MPSRFQPTGSHLNLPDGLTHDSFHDLREVISLATFEACDLGHPYVATHHLLLMLEKQHGTACQGVLHYFGLARPAILAAIENLDPRLPPLILMGRLAYTNGLHTALRHASREAARLRSPLITAEHLLIGVTHTRECVVAELLARHDLTPARLRREVLHWIGDHSEFL